MGDADGHPTFDRAVLDELRATLDDDELLRDITRSFLSEAPEHIARLASAWRAGDVQTVSTVAHLLKGSALTFGASRLAALCTALEESPSRAATLVAAVEQEYDALSRVLVAYVDP